MAPSPEDFLAQAVATLERSWRVRVRQRRYAPYSLAIGVKIAVLMVYAHHLHIWWAGPFFMFAFLAWLAQPTVPSPIERRLKDEILPKATVAMTPDLLRLRPLLPADTLREAVDAAFARLLPRFTDTGALDDGQRGALRQIALDHETRTPALATAALLALSDTGDAQLVDVAQHWRDAHADERLRDAADEYLRMGRTG